MVTLAYVLHHLNVQFREMFLLFGSGIVQPHVNLCLSHICSYWKEGLHEFKDIVEPRDNKNIVDGIVDTLDIDMHAPFLDILQDAKEDAEAGR